jgi:hypothetical protein
MGTGAAEQDVVAACVAELEGLRPSAAPASTPSLGAPARGQRVLLALALLCAALGGIAPVAVPAAALAWSPELGVAVAYMRQPTFTIEPVDSKRSLYRIGTETPGPWGRPFRCEPEVLTLGPGATWVRYSTGPDGVDERGHGDDVIIPWGPAMIMPWHLAHADAWCWGLACASLWGALAWPLLARPKGPLRLELVRALGLATAPALLAMGTLPFLWRDLAEAVPEPFASGFWSVAVTIPFACFGVAVALRAWIAPPSAVP